MRIGLDARFLTHPQAGGFKTYTTNLVGALAEVDPDNEYILYLDRAPKADTALPKQANFTTRIVTGSLPLIGMPWREQIGLPRQAARDKLDLFHSPSLTAPLRLPCPLVVTIHDMIWYFPHSLTNSKKAKGGEFGKRAIMNWYFRQIPEAAIRRANMIVTVSHAAKATILEHMGVPAEQVIVTHEAAGAIYRQMQAQDRLLDLRKRLSLPECFILAIGSADPRKNIRTLVQAYGNLPPALRERYHLAIVWTHNRLAEELALQAEVLGFRHQLHFVERVSDEDLMLLYNAASLFVFPSLYEGFGLPPLEAMACGTPVIAADNSSIPEIVGDAAVLVGAKDEAGITAALADVLSDPAKQAQLSAQGLKQAARFSWAKCGRETLEAYHQAKTNK
ncbi:MAG: glycosyltransferase family 4 protein [Anaerolineae bacterium]|nr:glycosyltransferase family 4 protein [Anaerolineae bacterium]